jgi:hypothetical protein
MAFHTLKKYALAMKLRPNPVMILHQMLARRDVLHVDCFAYIRERAPDVVLFAYEYRRGGRGEPIERRYYKATIGHMSPPRYVDARSWAPYDITDATRFNDDRALYNWAMRYHHQYMRKLAFLPLPKTFKHRSVLFHYFRAYDLNPTVGFHNFYGIKLARSERRKGMGRVSND